MAPSERPGTQVHFDGGRAHYGMRRSVCGLASYTLRTTTIAASVTCAHCIRLDNEGPNGDLIGDLK